MLRKFGLLLGCMLMIAVGLRGQELADARCISLMGVPLEGPDSLFIPALKSVGFEQVEPGEDEDDDPYTYYFTGDFYGIKANLEVNVNEKSKMLSEVFVTCGPYRTRELYDRNQKYLLLKLQREWGNFTPKGDGTLYMLNDYGYIRQGMTLRENGTRTINYFYLNSSPYYKDVYNMGLKGQVQEVITDNPVSENGIVHFSESGMLSADDVIEREYSPTGYLLKAAMVEPSGENSQLTYEYDDDGRLVKRTLRNTASGIRSVNEYKYNDDDEISTQTQKVFDKENECILSITMKNNYKDYDDNDNWTRNALTLTYWEKGERAQTVKVEQTRTISYWDD